MIISTISASNCTPQTIVIGRRGTYETMQIAFDLSYLIESYGNGVAVLAVKRSQDTSAYPAVVAQEDNTLTWTITETDTYYVGSGECQLMWYVDGGLAKTIIYPMVVMRDILSTSEEAPDAYQTWVDNLTALGAETLQNAQDAAQSASDAEDAKDNAVTAKEAAEAILEEFTMPAASATTLPAGSQATATYSDGNFAFGIPRGADGSPGTPGADGVTPDFSIGTVTTLEPTQPATATITGTAEAPVLNLGIPHGAKGDPGDPGETLVSSVNGKTGAVVLDATDVGAYEKPDTGIPATDLASAVQTSLGKADSAYQKPAGGITATDLASAVQTSLDKADTALQSAPVTSVAGKTGAITLNGGDVAYSESETYSSGTVGKELSDAKNAIEQKETKTTYTTLSGTTVTQTGEDHVMYLCGELATLSFTAPVSGITAIRFTSGTTPTVATFSGVTWLNGFDPTAIEASKTYEINILNGLGVAAWT